MINNEALGAAFVLSALCGIVGYALIWWLVPALSAPFLLFWGVASIGLCLVGVGSDEQ